MRATLALVLAPPDRRRAGAARLYRRVRSAVTCQIRARAAAEPRRRRAHATSVALRPLREPAARSRSRKTQTFSSGLEHDLEVAAVDRLLRPPAVDDTPFLAHERDAWRLTTGACRRHAVSTSAGRGAFKRPALGTLQGEAASPRHTSRGTTSARVSGIRDHGATSTTAQTEPEPVLARTCRSPRAAVRRAPRPPAGRARAGCRRDRRARPPRGAAPSPGPGSRAAWARAPPAGGRARRSPRAASSSAATSRRRRAAPRPPPCGTGVPPAPAGRAAGRAAPRTPAAASARSRPPRGRRAPRPALPQAIAHARGRALPRSPPARLHARFPSGPSRSSTAPPGSDASSPSRRTPSPSSSA